MEKTQPQIQGRFNWDDFNFYDDPQLVSPVQGEDALAVYEAVKHLGYFDYDEDNQEMQGSNIFMVARIDTLVQPLGLRVANLSDLSRPKVMSLVENNFYTDAPTLVVRSAKDSNSDNQYLLEQVIDLAEQKQGKVKFPFMVTGFDFRKPYQITTRPDFTVIEDKRLDGNYRRVKFDSVDDLGLPNFDKKGTRTWYARNQGIFRLYAFGSNLCSANHSLSESYHIGRVVLVSKNKSNCNF